MNNCFTINSYLHGLGCWDDLTFFFSEEPDCCVLCCCCTSFLDKRGSVLPQQTQEMNSTEVSRNPGRLIANKQAQMTKRKSCLAQISLLGNLKVAIVSCYLTALGVCLFRTPWERVHRQGVVVVELFKIYPGGKKKSQHLSVPLLEWKLFTYGVKEADLWQIIWIKISPVEYLKCSLFPLTYKFTIVYFFITVKPLSVCVCLC